MMEPLIVNPATRAPVLAEPIVPASTRA